MNKTTCIAECDTLGHSLKQVHIIIYLIRNKLCITQFPCKFLFAFKRAALSLYTVLLVTVASGKE